MMQENNIGDKMQRPLDVLGGAIDKRVIVRMKSNETITGNIKAFDQHINIWLDDSEIQNTNGETVKLGRVLVRGDNIVLVSPVK